jgi:hypothetical protein
MKKKYAFLILLIIIFNSSFGQKKSIEIIGLWQSETSEVSSMYHDTYQFSKDSKFIFKPNQYNGLNRVLSIEGNYEIKGDSIILKPHFTKELIGGYPVRSMITTLSDSWEIEGGKIKNIQYKKKIKQTATIKLCEKANCILIDERRFYKIIE